ncbi:MAG: MoaD/ThiS family protein [Flavobacteriales bacterium]|nr:MoaD/ThiS family protein [Flavobacteriales bacterium]NQX97355.1 MoaD/ThiS family protein [Flavobacteriales bacterium]
MTLKIKYFGMTAEASGKEGELLDNKYSSVQILRKELLNKYPGLIKMNFKIAVNQHIVDDNCLLSGNEEIALLPPFAGG